MLRVIIFAVIVTFVASDSLVAQTQSRRGRFFQKIKNDIFGSSKQSEANKQLTQQQNTKSQQPKGRVPTPLKNASSNAQQTASKNVTANPQTRNSARSLKPASVSQRNGFGFTVSVNDDDKLFVSNIDRNGNAQEAGLRRGDKVKEIGGIEASNVEEFDEIAKIMGQGDEMEFKITRSGNDKNVSVRFGQMPESTEMQEPSPVSTRSPNRRYDFAPPSGPRHEGAQSVLSNRQSQNETNNQPRQQFSDQSSKFQIQTLNQTIAKQNQKIQQLQRQIIQLRQQRGTR